MRYIGIDPGLTGAFAILADDGLVNVWDMPIMPNGKGKAKIKNQVNPASLAGTIRACVGHDEVIAYMEMVSSMPKDAQSIAFSLGDSVGVMRGVLATLGIPLHLVRAKEWKRHFKLLQCGKDYSRTVAQQLFPSAPLELKKHHGRAEALLIAKYGSMQP